MKYIIVIARKGKHFHWHVIRDGIVWIETPTPFASDWMCLGTARISLRNLGVDPDSAEVRRLR